MDAKIYNTREWRNLPREICIVALLFGERVGPCDGPIDRHHRDRLTDDTIEVCHRHHPKLEAALRRLDEKSKRKRCPHVHRYPGAREACERRLNRELATAA